MTSVLLNSESVSDLVASETVPHDVIVIGGGISGLSAGLYAARGGRDTLVLEGELVSSVDYPGGQLMLTPEIENFPGFAGGSGEDLVTLVRNQTQGAGAHILTERVTEFHPNPETGLHRVVTSEGTYSAPVIILATGAIARRLEVEGEDRLFGRGVSTCATCDGAFFKGKTVAVVGGGEVAVEDALYLTRHAAQVYMIHRRDQLRATSPQARDIVNNPLVQMVWNSHVTQVHGQNKVDSITVVNSDGEETLLPLDGLFVAVGHDPQSEILRQGSGLVDLFDNGYVITNGTRTNIAGVYAAGDVVDSVYRQAITAAASGAQAAMDALRDFA